jgi:beta-lactamase regulating signal transducer with metallopeptidase domain
MSDPLSTLGLAALLAWIVLPLLALVARRAGGEPSARQRALTLALILGALAFAAPFVRVWTHHFTALCMTAESVGATLVLAPARALSENAAGPSALRIVGAVAALLVFTGAARLLFSAFKLRRVLRRAEPAPAELRRAAEALARAMKLPVPSVLVSAEASVPFVAGTRRPTIVVPSVLAGVLDEEQRDLVLAHELTHLVRRDLELAWVVAIARIPFALHPAARWIAREIAVAREQAVDALVGAKSPKVYARLLVDVAECARFGRCSSLVAMEVTQLERRIFGLLEPQPLARRSTAPVLLAGTAILLLMMIAPRPAETTPFDSAWGRCVQESVPQVIEEDCTTAEDACFVEICEQCDG